MEKSIYVNPTPFCDKNNTQPTSVERIFFNFMKGIYKKPTAE